MLDGSCIPKLNLGKGFLEVPGPACHMLQIQHFLSQTPRRALHRAQWGDHGAADYWQEGGPTPRCSSPHCRGSAPLSAPAGQADSQIHLNPSGSGGECVQKGASLNIQKAALFPCVSSGKVWKGFLVGALMRAYQILSTARIRVIDVEKNIFNSPLIWFVLRGFHAWVFFFPR